MERKIAFFDFDGTITYKDSLIHFLVFCFGWFKVISGFIFISPYVILYKLKVISNERAKEKLLAYFFKELKKEDVKQFAIQYTEKCLPKILREKAIEKIEWHKSENHEIYLVSASLEDWLRPWCENMQISCLGTQLEVINGVYSGKFQSKNCYGPEKVNRIKQELNLSDYNFIYAYGDSRGDSEMLKIANEGHFKPFRN